jgi:hypothetical protein
MLAINFKNNLMGIIAIYAKKDGFILESDMTTGSALAAYQNAGVGVNHMEALNHPETWINLNAIFDRGEFDFFNTPTR